MEAAKEVPIELDQGVPHYTTLTRDLWPMDLSKYETHTVLRFQFDDADTKNILINTQRALIASDIWGKSVTKRFIDILFPNESVLEQFITNCTHQGLNFKVEILVEDVLQLVFETFSHSDQSKDENDINIKDITTQSDLFFKSYRPLKTIYAWMDILEQSYPDLVTIEWVGQTYDGRDLKLVHVRTKNDLGNPDRKTVVITGGMHAREWVSVSSTCFILNELLSRYEEGRKKEVFYMQNLDFIFVPVMNPDGYEYTWTSDRLWRKNRQETYNPRCFGIDIDHSFDYHWQHSDDLPCGEDYSGETSFESIESEIWNSYLNKTKSELQIYGYIDLHSYAQEVLYPYAYSCDQRPRDTENLIELAYGLSKAIRLKSGKHYDVLSACLDRDVDLIPSLGSGSLLDYMYHNRAFWAFQIKLRDSGSHGFLMPPKYIQPVGKEIFSSIRYFCNFVLSTS